ncbi:MAG: thioredoxin family protein [Chloroflexi bacterium]|nr:thioredoxin family protein [Chloroflexota bacterium]
MAAVLSKDRFEAATTFAQYHERMQANKERMGQFVDEVQISDADLAWWRGRGPIKVLALTYDSCGDALYNIPILAKIAQQCPNVDLRVIQRDENLDIMDRYLNQGIYRSVPTFIFMSENLEEIGNLKERPEEITRVIEAEMLGVRRRLRDENKDAWRGVVAAALKTTAGG